MASNVDILTRSHTVLKAKARAKKNQIDSIVFDDTARHEYLTGFRKRNLEKRQAAKEKAKERDRLEHLQARKEHRQALQERAIENAEMVESAFRKKIDGSDDENDNTEFRGFSTFGKGKGKAIQEYEDEEQLATVTVIEEFDPNSLRDMPSTSQGSSRSESEPHAPLDLAEVRRKGRQRFTSHPGSGGTSRHGRVHAGTANTLAEKLPPKKISNETKAARKAARQKQRVRKVEKAGLAGDKSRRRERGGGAKKSKKGKKGLRKN